MNQQTLTDPHQQGSARPEGNQTTADPIGKADLQYRNYGIPEWLPRVAGVLLPSPKLWKHRRRVLVRSHEGWSWQFIAPALLLMLGMQSLFIWQLYSPITAPLVLAETEIEIEIPIDLSTLITESEPEAGSAAAIAPASQAAQTAQAKQPAQAAVSAKSAAAPTKSLPAAVPPQIIESPAASVAKAVVTAPSLSVKIPMPAPIVEPTPEQSVLESEGLAEAQKIAPMLEPAEQVVDTEITLAPMSAPITPDIVEPLRPAVPIAFAQEKPVLDAVKPQVKPPTPVEIQTVSVATPPERVEIEIPKPVVQKPALLLSEPSITQQITQATPALIPAEAIAIERPDRSSIAQIEPQTQAISPERTTLAMPSVAQTDTQSINDAQSDAAQANMESSEMADGTESTSPSDALESVTQSNNQPGLDLYGGIARAAADQAAQNAPTDGRNAFRRYDDPFVDDQPSRLEGLRLREPQLFLDLAKFLVGQLSSVGAQYALVQLGANEEINDFTDVDLGPLIKAWIDLHHGDLSKQCRQNNPELSAAMRDVLCGSGN